VAGAQVMHPRALEIAARYGVRVRVLSSLLGGDEGGTLIAQRNPTMEDPALTGVASEAAYAQLVLRGLPAEMNTMTQVLTRLTDAGVSVDLLTQLDGADGRRSVQLTVSDAELAQAEAICRGVIGELGGDGVDVMRDLARVTLVGSGMHKRPGVFAHAFEALRTDNVDVHSVSASSVSIILMVGGSDEDRAVRLLHDAFDLGEDA
jgi:aspartate kinase